MLKNALDLSALSVYRCTGTSVQAMFTTSSPAGAFITAQQCEAGSITAKPGVAGWWQSSAKALHGLR